jgi:hypothetical protein
MFKDLIHNKVEDINVLLLDDKSDLFEKKILQPKQAGKDKIRTSVLSAQLKSCPYMPQNPFLEYSKHDGSVSYYFIF